jgi:hypothetical protein
LINNGFHLLINERLDKICSYFIDRKANIFNDGAKAERGNIAMEKGVTSMDWRWFWGYLER